MATTLHNPATEGVAGLKGINQIKDDGRIPSGIENYKLNRLAASRAIMPVENVGVEGVGASRFDDEISSLSQLYDLDEFRAQHQSGLGQFLNGTIKGAALAGTTFLDGTVGSVVGLIQGIINLADKDEKTGFWEGLWNNEFSQAMNGVNKMMEDTFKNYYTRDEIENPLAARNVFSANFIGDKLVKNLGFTIGAFYSGKAFNSLLQATRLPAVLRMMTGSSRVPKMVMSGTGATASAFNEGRIMALEDSNNWKALQEEEAEERYNKRLEDAEVFKGTSGYEGIKQNALIQYQEELKRIEEDQAKMGNLEMFLNLPVLLASNLFEFGKLYANGFKTARRLSKNATAPTIAGAITKGVWSGATEGIEEVAQGAISNISGLGYEQDVLNFYKLKKDKEAEEDTIDWMKAISKGLNDTFNDSATAEEFLIGSLTGLFGMPVFGKSNTSQAWLGKDKAVGLAGGLGGAITDYNEEKERYEKITNYVNDRTANNKEFLNYYQGLIRHVKTQKDMDKAAANGSSRDFKNAEFDQMLSDIQMFDNAGKLEDYMALIESAFDTSDENLETIIENTTTTLEDGSKKGPFIDSNGNKATSTPEGKAKMIEQLTKSKDEMIQTIQEYAKIKDEIDLNTSESLSDDDLEVLTSMKMKIGNWKSRIKDMYPSIKEGILQLKRDWHNYTLNTHDTTLDEWRSLTGFEDTLNRILESDEEQFEAMLHNPKFIETLYNVLQPLVASGNSTMSTLEFEDLFQKLKDSRDLQKAIVKHTVKFNGYINDIQSLKTDLENTYSELEKKFEDTLIEEDVNTVLNSAKDIKTLTEALKTIPQNRLPQVFQKVVDKANEEQKKVLQAFDELSDIAQSFGEFDITNYSNETAAMLASNMESIMSNAESKDDVFNALEALKNALVARMDVDGVEAVEALIKHVKTALEEIAKAADTPTTQTASTGSSLLGSMVETANVETVAPTEVEGIAVEGNTREEALQNAVDKVTDLANNNGVEVLNIVANDGVSNPNLTPEDVAFVKEAAKSSIPDFASEGTDSSKQSVDKQNLKASIKGKNDKSLSSSVVTEYSINDGKNKKKKPYIPTDEALAKLQKLLKESGAYRLIESGKVGVLNNRTRNGININFLTNTEYPGTILLATEVTEEFKKRIKVQYEPISIDGKEYALLGVLKNDSSEKYSEIVNQVKIETEEQTGTWKVAQSTTKIKQFYSGRMVTSDETGSAEDRNLSNLITGKTLGRDYGFTIVYTNEDKYIGVDPSIDAVTPLNSYLKPEDKRNGSLWLMARGSNGIWYPHYVSIARTGEVDWRDIKFFDDIRKVIKTIAQNNTLEKKLQAKLALNKTVFFPTGNKFSFTDEFISIGGTKINKKDYATDNEYIEAVVELLKSKNLRFQVSARGLSEDSTRNNIIEAGIIKTDLLQLEHINGSFDIYGLNETPKGTSIEHTGSRQVSTNTRTHTTWLGGTQYNKFVDESGRYVWAHNNGAIVENQSVISQLDVIESIETGRITGVEVGNSTLYEIVHNNKKYHVQKTAQQPIKFISAQEYGRKIKKQKQQSLELPTGGLLSSMTAVATPPSAEELGVSQGEVTQPTPPPATVETKPEEKPSPKKPVKGRSQALDNIKRRRAVKQGVDAWIKEKQLEIVEAAKNYNFNGTLSTEVIKGLFEKNNISLDTISDAEDLMRKLEYILNCKQ